MFLLSFFRAIKFSFQDIVRNIWLSLVTVTILVLAIFSINILFTVDAISNATISSIKEKIDINLYLNSEASKDQVMALKTRIGNMINVREVRYISKAEALESFKANHQNNPEILEALRELGKNPLTPSLVIKPNDIGQYDSLITNLNKIDDDIIESRNFDDHKLILGKINNISKKINKVGLIVSLIFIFTTILVVYNAIRVAIYTHRKEIIIMKLVGASNWFIRLPFLISGATYALIGILLTIAIFIPLLGLLQPYLEIFFIDYNFNILTYFNDNFIKIFGFEFLAAALINVLASLIAVGKYSKV
jgi:cell division transport system permease protein